MSVKHRDTRRFRMCAVFPQSRPRPLVVLSGHLLFTLVANVYTWYASTHLSRSLPACGFVASSNRAGKVELSPGLDVDVKDKQNNWLPGKVSGLQGSSVSGVMTLYDETRSPFTR